MARSAKSIIGKTVSGVISKRLGASHESIVILQFSDGSCFEFVSPRAQRLLNRMAATSSARLPGEIEGLAQLSFFPQDGVAGHAATPTAAAA